MNKKKHLAEPLAGDVVAGVIASDVADLRRHVDGVHDGVPRAVHGARIALRRLRTDLKMFDRILDPDWARASRARMRELGPALAPVRHVDALIAALADVATADSALAADAVSAAVGLGPARERYVDAMLDVLAADRSVLDLPEQPSDVPVRAAGDAALAAHYVLPGVVHRPLRRLERFTSAGRPETDRDAVRVLARHCRYVAEAVGDTVPGAARLSSAAARLHELLGDLQDAERLAAWAAETRGRLVLTDGLRERLAGRARQQITLAEQSWPDALDAVLSAGDRVRTPPDAPPLLLGGGLVVRAGTGAPEILVVHSPRREQWSLPKGRAEPGESAAGCAAREVGEETGVLPRVHDEAVTLSRRDRSGRRKLVSWWMMTPATDYPAGERSSGDTDGEVDAVRWLPVNEAQRMLPKADRRVLRRALAVADFVA